MSYQFQGQLPSEEVLLITHQHPFFLLPALLKTIGLLVIPVFIYSFFPTGWVLSVSILITVPWALIRTVELWFCWSRTLLLLTTERIVFLEQLSVFKRELVETPIKGVQQVSHEVVGVMGTLAGYGSLRISTGSSLQAINIKHIPDPFTIQQEILAAGRGVTTPELALDPTD